MEENKSKREGPGSRTLVKCTICGEIFDSSLEVCPVCKAGKKYFVPYTEEKVLHKKNTDEIFVILGNGAAGTSAAEAIRERNETCSIYMVSNEPVNGYNRPMLTKSLSSLGDADEISMHDATWYKDNRIETILDTQVVSIDTTEKIVRLSGEKQLKFDKCIYALGAECFIPPFAGVDKPQVIAVRRFADVKKIQSLTPDVKNVVVIGGGVLGLEAAWELSKSANVTVLEVADKLMVRQLDDTAGNMIADILQRENIQFRINAKITEITGEGSVTGVCLDDGTLYPADLVIISCGVRANTAVAKAAGIDIDRAVVVNDKMETSVKDIYACGDCAEFRGINYAIWPQAINMGSKAGANAAGETASYEPEPAALTFEGMNTALFAAGDNGKTEGRKYKTVEFKDEEKLTYEKYYFTQDRLAGVILIGDTTKMVELTEALKEGRYYKELF